ncbi:DUF481 domain-containing protein [Pseudomonas sp. A3.4]|nr:DUF481 domain-containing protein [Atopomonas sediminilitoris]
MVRYFFLLWLAFGAAHSLADTVWLNNGDRLSGEVILLDSGILVFSTPYAGRLHIQWSDVETLSSSKELLVKEGVDQLERSKELDAAGPGMVRLVNGEAPRAVPLASITQLMTPKPFVEDFLWEGNIDGSLDMKRKEDDSDKLRFKGTNRLEHGRWRHRANLETEYETENQVKKEDNYTLEYSLDRFITEQWFWTTGYKYQRDRFEELERQREIGTGPGYQFWDNELGRLDLTAELNRIRYDQKLQDDFGVTQHESESLDTGSVNWDYKRVLWGSRFELTTTGVVHFPFTDQVDYATRGDAGLRYRVNDWARLSLLFEFDQVRGLEETYTEKRYLLGVGVGW